MVKVVTLIEQWAQASKIVLSSMLIDHSGTLGNIMEHLSAFLNENLSVRYFSPLVQSTDCIQPQQAAKILGI